MSQLPNAASGSFMRWCMAAFLLAGSAGTQEVHPVGRIVVWIVSTSSGPAIRARTDVAAAQLPAEVQSQTAGSFGRTAGSVGQNAGDAGQKVGSFGQAAGATGKNAGDVGQTAGSFGGAAGSAGRNAGDAGRTMAEFGVSTTDLSEATAAANRVSTGSRPRRTVQWEDFVTGMRSGPFEEVAYVDVFGSTLDASLAAVAGTADAPDVLVGMPLPYAWAQSQRRRELLGIAMLWNPAWGYTAHSEGESGRRSAILNRVDTVVLANARNLEGAEAFVAWVNGLYENFGYWNTAQPGNEPGKVAVRALNTMLVGGTPEAEADPQMARYRSDWFAFLQQGLREDWTEHICTRSRVMEEARDHDFAVVMLRGVVYGPKAFGVTHALALLRRDAEGKWRLLQMTPNMESQPLANAWRQLLDAEDGRTAAALTEGTEVRGVRQAAPLNGASVASQPQLWWDNFGGATLQAVEWQRDEGGWTLSNLYFVPDANSRLRTQVQARFAAAAGTYRWRVWSLGTAGKLKLGPWRTMQVVSR